MAGELRWTAGAAADFEFIIRDQHARNGHASAANLGQRLDDAIAVLQQFPRIGPLFRRSRGREIREVSSPPFRVFYTLHGDPPTSIILAIQHGARRDPKPGALLDRLD